MVWTCYSQLKRQLLRLKPPFFCSFGIRILNLSVLLLGFLSRSSKRVLKHAKPPLSLCPEARNMKWTWFLLMRYDEIDIFDTWPDVLMYMLNERYIFHVMFVGYTSTMVPRVCSSSFVPDPVLNGFMENTSVSSVIWDTTRFHPWVIWIFWKNERWDETSGDFGPGILRP